MALSQGEKDKAYTDGEKHFKAGKYDPPVKGVATVLSLGLANTTDDLERDRIYHAGRDNAKKQS